MIFKKREPAVSADPSPLVALESCRSLRGDGPLSCVVRRRRATYPARSRAGFLCNLLKKTEGIMPVEDLIKKLMGQLGEFAGKLHQAREACRSKYRVEEPEPRNRLRIMIDGLMALLADAVTTPIANVTESSSYQITLSASFIRTHFLACDMIINGDVVEAFVLTRKQLESLARLNELDSKPLAKLYGKTPNIQNALKGGAGVSMATFLRSPTSPHRV